MLVLVFVALVFNVGVVVLVFDVWLFGCLVVGCWRLDVVRELFGFEVCVCVCVCVCVSVCVFVQRLECCVVSSVCFV